MSQYDFPCEYCTGTVRERTVDQEPIAHHRGIVVLEKVPIGICDRCGAHYYAASVLKKAETLLSAPPDQRRTMQVPCDVY
jgi:YgiT-type zinc finger domain-containing protein